MATHSSILAWKNSRTEEPGGLQSMGSQRVRHDQAINPNSYLEYIRGFTGSSADKKKSTSERSLEKETATHSSILAWRIPWTEEHGGLQSMGSQRVGHN